MYWKDRNKKTKELQYSCYQVTGSIKRLTIHTYKHTDTYRVTKERGEQAFYKIPCLLYQKYNTRVKPLKLYSKISLSQISHAFFQNKAKQKANEPNKQTNKSEENKKQTKKTGLRVFKKYIV